MSEEYQIVSRARGEPLPEGCTGVRVRVQLSGCPSRRWSLDLAARLSQALVGHAGVGHLRLTSTTSCKRTRSSSKASSSARHRRSATPSNTQLTPRTGRAQPRRTRPRT
jgi:hypothetical protein